MKITWRWLVPLVFIQTQNVLAEVITDGSLGGAAQSLSGPNYLINSALGQTKGGNLFHSFSEFNINKGESANFQSTDTTSNIFARVTGGHSSLIDGKITSTGTANLWMINPAGWVIGQNASLNLPGSFHLSTATGIDFKDGGLFLADAKSQSTLSIASPIDYQFQSSQAATITIDHASLVLKTGMDISLVGGNINLQDAHIKAPAGRILLGSNAGAGGKWQLDNSGLTQVSGQQGTITIEHSQPTLGINPSLSINEPTVGNITTARDWDSKIQLAANQITLKSAFISATAGDNLSRRGGDVELKGETITLANSFITTTVLGDQAGGNIKIHGKDLLLTGLPEQPLRGGSKLSSKNSILSNGNSGAIAIDLTGELRLSDQAGISSTVQGNGAGGNIVVNSPLVNLNSASFISVESSLGKGNPGDITVNSHDLNINQGSFLASSSNLESQGDAGDIIINSPHISMDEGRIFSGTDKSSTGATGDIRINPVNANASSIANDAFLKMQHSIISTTNNRVTQGDGGNISVNTGTLVMNGGYVQANSAALNGSGGTVTVNAQRSIVSHEQLDLGSNERKVFNQNPNLNVIQAAAPQGRSGEVNVSKVELNIAGQLAKVDANFANNRPIANDPCSVRRGEEISSLIQSGNGGMPPNASDAVSLPLQRHATVSPSVQPTNRPSDPVGDVDNTSNSTCEKDKR